MTGPLAGGAWRALLPRALILIDEIRRRGLPMAKRLLRSS